MSNCSSELDDEKICFYFNPAENKLNRCRPEDVLNDIRDCDFLTFLTGTDVMDGWEGEYVPILTSGDDLSGTYFDSDFTSIYAGFPYRGPKNCAKELFSLACRQAASDPLTPFQFDRNIRDVCNFICTDDTFAALGSPQERFSFVQELMEQQHFKERKVPEEWLLFNPEWLSNPSMYDSSDRTDSSSKLVRVFISNNDNGSAVLTRSPQELLADVRKNLPQLEEEPLQAQAVVLNLDSQTIYSATDRDINALGREYLTEQALETVRNCLQSIGSGREHKAALVIGNLLDVQLGDDSYRNHCSSLKRMLDSQDFPYEKGPASPFIYKKGIAVVWPSRDGIKAIQKLMTIAAATDPALTQKVVSFIASDRIFSSLGPKEQRMQALRTLAQTPGWPQEVARVRQDVVTRREAPASKNWLQGLSQVRKDAAQNALSR